MIHIVFGASDIEVLKKAIELEPQLDGEVRIIRDDFAVGPIESVYETTGYQRRRDWWKALLDASPYSSGEYTALVDDRMTVHQLAKQLEEDPKQEVWIWMGQNAHDVSGYYWLISQLSAFQGRVVVIYLNNLPFINEKGNIFYPSYLHEIQPKEFLKARKLNRKVTGSEFEVDPDEWKKLCSEDAPVRILEGAKKLAGKPETFFDNDIMNGLSKEWQKGQKLMHNILGKMRIKTGDVFLLSRMKAMADAGVIEMNGDPSKGWKEFELRMKTNAEPDGEIMMQPPINQNAQ